MKKTMMLVLFALMMAAAVALAENEQMTGEEAIRLSVQAIDKQLGGEFASADRWPLL